MVFGNKFYQLGLIKLDLFKEQNPETGRFDVTFEVDGKVLYAHKNMLNLVSDTFDAMISERWTKKDVPIKIKDYSYDYFYQFITFLYSAKCELSDENIFAMVDMAEFYGVELFKEYCDDYLAAMKITVENIFKLIDLADRYSLIRLKAFTDDFIIYNFQNFIDSEGFFKADKSFIKELAVVFKDRIKPEDMFQAVYKWAEKQAVDKQTANPSLTVNDTIKAEISDLLPFICFKKMKLKFMVEFLVPRVFIFSSHDELCKIMDNGVLEPIVKVTNVHGQTLQGNLIPDKIIIENIKSLNSSTCFYGTKTWCWWNKMFEIPFTPSTLKKKNGIQWYLAYFSEGEIGVFNPRYIDESHYLLAELSAGDSEFDAACGCTIEISE